MLTRVSGKKKKKKFAKLTHVFFFFFIAELCLDVAIFYCGASFSESSTPFGRYLPPKKNTQIQVPALHNISTTTYDSKLAGLGETQSIRKKSCVTLYDSVPNLGGSPAIVVIRLVGVSV